MFRFILSSVVWLFSFWVCPSPMPLFNTSETVVWCLSFTPRFPRLAEIWMLEVDLYWKGYCLLLEYSCLKSAFRNYCPIRGFRSVDEGLKAPDFDFSVFFFFRALVSACHIVFQSSESLSIDSFSYSAATVQPPSVESAILINLFLFFSLEMTAFNEIETGYPVHLKYCRWCPVDLPLYLC